MAPIEDRALFPRLWALLQTYLRDNRQAWDLAETGTWTQRQPEGPVRASHEILLRESWGQVREDLGGVNAPVYPEPAERAAS